MENGGRSKHRILASQSPGDALQRSCVALLAGVSQLVEAHEA